MSITDELRKEARGFGRYVYTAPQADCLTAIADRIDAEYERVKAESIIDMTDENMAESGWVRLPVDADGVPIHVGDVMENIVCPPVHREEMGVGVECFYGWDDGNGRYSQFDVNCYRHHHEPTVEDMLREFAEKITDSQVPGVHPTYEEAIAEYAAKLTLRGEE